MRRGIRDSIEHLIDKNSTPDIWPAIAVKIKVYYTEHKYKLCRPKPVHLGMKITDLASTHKQG